MRQAGDSNGECSNSKLDYTKAPGDVKQDLLDATKKAKNICLERVPRSALAYTVRAMEDIHERINGCANRFNRTGCPSLVGARTPPPRGPLAHHQQEERCGRAAER